MAENDMKWHKIFGSVTDYWSVTDYNDLWQCMVAVNDASVAIVVNAKFMCEWAQTNFCHQTCYG